MIKIKYVHMVKNDSYRRMVVLYDDGTWEDLFRFPYKQEQFDGKNVVRKTRSEALNIIHDFISKD